MLHRIFQFSHLIILLICSLPSVARGQDTLLEQMTPDASEATQTNTAAEWEISRFEQAISDIESAGGAFAPAISEQVLGLARLLQAQGRHPEAADILKRGIHVARVNHGLYGAEQIPLLRAQIASLQAMQEYAAVDERQRYLYRVERQALGSGLASVNALMRQGEWQRDAFLLGIDAPEEAPSRLLIMWDVYRLALNQLIDIYGSNHLALEPALEGMLTSQYLIAGYRGFDRVGGARSGDLRYTAYSSEAYRRGISVLRALMELHATNNDDAMDVRARDLQRLGDWSWWFGNRREAMAPYNEALDLANAYDPSGELASQLFDSPAALPDLPGIEPLPPAIPGDSGDVVFSFGVTSLGRVDDLERLRQPEVEDEEEEKAISRLERLLRNTRFRPRISGGEAVPTRNMVWSFNANDWQGLK